MENEIDRKILLWKDPVMVKILHSVSRRARTPGDISRQVGIPLKTCYDKLGRLRRMNLLSLETELIAPNGSMVRYYKADTTNKYVTLDGGRTKVRLDSALACF